MALRYRKGVRVWRAPLVTLLLGLSLAPAAYGQVTAFTYQGRLKSGGNAADGQFDFQFSLWDALTGGAQHGPTLTFDGVGADPAPITVAGGLFTVELDFGDRFPGAPRYLHIAVRPHAVGSYTPLTPRQQLTPTPYALGLQYPFVGNGANGANPLFSIQNTSSGGVAIAGESSLWHGVYGRNGAGSGLAPLFGYGTGAWGDTDNGNGAVGTSGTGFGMYGATGAVTGINPPSTAGVVGESHDGRGVIGLSVNNDGLYGDGANGVQGVSSASSGNGVLGICNVGGSAYGVWGESSTGYGVVGTQAGNSNFGELGTPNNGVYGQSYTGAGIWAEGTGDGLTRVALRADNQSGGGIAIWGTTNSSDANAVLTNSGTGDLIKGFSGPSGGNLVFEVQNNGTTVVSVLQVTGADLAEHFPMAEKVQPGMVVEIDPDTPGKLRLAHGTYNHRVAGVISGANKLNAGVVLSDGKVGEQDQPVALSGRVWAYCDATEHPIAPGDLITTAERPGYAMAVTDRERADGAILGKAMSGLKQGETGLVLVLVNLR